MNITKNCAKFLFSEIDPSIYMAISIQFLPLKYKWKGNSNSR